ncbi:MAG: hypothetical protein ABMA64_38460 [Myxococcota bacterium]
MITLLLLGCSTGTPTAPPAASNTGADSVTADTGDTGVCGFSNPPALPTDGELFTDTGADHVGYRPEYCVVSQPLVEWSREVLPCWDSPEPPTIDEFLLATGWVQNPPPGATPPWFWYDASEVTDAWFAGRCDAADPPVDLLYWRVDLYDGPKNVVQFSTSTGQMVSHSYQATFYGGWDCSGVPVDDVWWGEYRPVDLGLCDLHDRDYWIEALGVEPAEPPPPSPAPAVAPEAGCGCFGQAPGAWWAVALLCLLAIPKLRRGSSDDHAAAARV